jgi:DNA-binding NarL/FixJ family response regulator
VHSILIVDDHADFRMRTRALLEAEGFLVVGEATDGASGVEAVRSLNPDLVLLDIGLPDVDGFEVARGLAAGFRPLSIVLVSSRPATDYGRRIADSPALGFIAKEDLSGAAIRSLMGDG